MLFDVSHASTEVAQTLMEVPLGELFNEAFGSIIKILWELDFLGQSHFEKFHGVIGHEGRSTIKHLKQQDAEGVPISWLRVALLLDYLRRDVLWGSTESVSACCSRQVLDESKVSQL